jgi:hypothetical protein
MRRKNSLTCRFRQTSIHGNQKKNAAMVELMAASL